MNILKYTKKYFFLIFILSFFINISNIYKVNNSFNNFSIENNKIIEHKIIKGDSLKYWNIASELDGNFFTLPLGYRNAQLYPKIIYLYSELTNQKLFDEYGNAILNKKFNILYFQLLIYFFSLIIFYKSLHKNINVKYLPELIILLLSIDPFINQVHHAIFTESIFITILIILISLIINLNSVSIKNFLLLGLVIGFLFMQRGVAVFYIYFLVPFFLYFFKNSRFKIMISLFSGYLLVILFIAISSYYTFGKVRITPTQSETAIFGYLAPNVYAKQKKISIAESKKIFLQKKTYEFVEANSLNLNNFEDFQLLLKFQKEYGYKVLLNDPKNTIKVLIYNYSKNLFLHYNWVIEFFASSGKKNEQNIQSVNREKNSFLKRAIYSLIYLSITLIGFVSSFKILDKKIIIFLSISFIYFYAVSGWIGNPRYFLPSYLFGEIFFALGIFFILKKFSINKLG